MNFQTLTIEDLKAKYSDRHGFVFQSSQPSSDKAIENLCNTLIEHKITKEMPEVVTRLDPVTTAYVYKDDFDGPAFFQKATIATQAGVCNIEPLVLFLKQQ